MKAKYFKKSRSKVQYYYVSETIHLFGYWNSYLNNSGGGLSKVEVLATNPHQAVLRYLKRTNQKDFYEHNETSAEWAKFRVIPKDKPYDRFITYYR